MSFSNICSKLTSFISDRQHEVLLLIRVILGVIFIQTGIGKLMYFQDTTAFFAALHIPFPALNAGLASATELIGGLCFVLGLGTRLFALPLAFVMVIAIVTAKLGDVTTLSDFIRLQELDYLVFFVLFSTTGAGKWSLDAVLGKKFCTK